jgi:hypothetical protein
MLMQVNKCGLGTYIVAKTVVHHQWGCACSSLQKKRQVLAPACSQRIVA